MTTASRWALKEWAVTVRSLANGTQILLLRKGGIDEQKRRFELENRSFYLYPTFDHQRADLLQPRYRRSLEALGTLAATEPSSITHWARVVHSLETSSQDVVNGLAPFYIWTTDYASERLRWKRRQPLHILMLRVYELGDPALLPVDESYLGCRSWVELKARLPMEPMRPVLPDAVFDATLGAIRTAVTRTDRRAV